MTEPVPESGRELADYVVAQNVGFSVSHTIQAAAFLASSLGTDITVPQMLAAFLVSVLRASDQVITRAEFLSVYDHVVASMATDNPAVEASTRPEDTAHAESAEDATAMASYWADKIAGLAFPEAGWVPDYPPSEPGEETPDGG